MQNTTYGTGATNFTDGSSRLVRTISKKSRVRKKYKKRKKK
tara:strand:+ start:564 stop:686 length:123 start_codon:yes stop_codon:yes gene_type:complete